MTRTSLIPLGLLALVAAGSAKAGQPTGDLIVVPKTEEYVLGGTRHYDHLAIGRGLGSRVKESLAGGRILVVRPPDGTPWQTYRQNLIATGSYESVEPDTIAMPTALANDPSLSTQWHLFQISAPRVWDYSSGASAPILAVVDGGVDLTHPDLIPSLVPGYNTISELAQVQGGNVSDVTTNGHGTRVAGVAAARGNNGVGVSGVGWNLRLMPIRATDQASGATPRSELIEGATWAIQNGAKVVNVSYTEVQFADIETLGAWARTQGSLLVWSAGNSNTKWSNFDHDNVTVVGGTDQNDQIWYSNVTTGSGYGKGVDCFAPATLVYTTRKGAPWYGYAPAGVSFAVPQVAATLALMMGREPALSPTDIERRMLLRCFDMGPLGNDLTNGYGRLNAGAAVEWPVRKYSLETISLIGIPNAIGSRVRRLADDGTVYVEVFRNGASPLLARWKEGVWIDSIAAEALAPDITAIGIAVGDVNQFGHAVGGVWSGSVYRGFYWKPGIGVIPQPTLGFDRSYLSGINGIGQAVGYVQNNGSGFMNGAFMASNGIFSQPASQPPFNLTGSHSYSKIDEDGVIIGLIGAQPFRFSDFIGVVPGESAGGYTGTEIVESSEEGAFASNFFGPGNIVPYAYLYDTKGKIFKQFGSMVRAEGINESLEVVGAETSANQDSLKATILYGFSTGRLEQHLEPRPENPNTVFPPNILDFIEVSDVNNRGQLIVRATSTLGEAGLFAKPVDTPGLGLDLGQLGASPTYIGSIPPSLNVTFTNALGEPYPNATVQNVYRGSQGVLNIAPPESVTGSYRVYLRANANVIPGYSGPAYLNRLYPPLNLPAAPRDSFYLPYGGANTVGPEQPVLEMYAGDLDLSGEIDATDIDIVIANFGLVDGLPGWNPSFDVDGTGEIDAIDIDLVISNFGLTSDPEP